MAQMPAKKNLAAKKPGALGGMLNSLRGGGGKMDPKMLQALMRMRQMQGGGANAGPANMPPRMNGTQGGMPPMMGRR